MAAHDTLPASSCYGEALACGVVRVIVSVRRRLCAEALTALLSADASLRVVGWAPDAQSVVDVFASRRADVVVFEGQAPADELLQSVRTIRHGGIHVPVLLVTDDVRTGFIQRVIGAKIDGLVSTADATQEVLRTAVRDVAAGRRSVPQSSFIGALESKNPLKTHEIDVLRLAARGMSSRDIASRVHVSRGTARNYLSAAIRKIGAANRIEAGRIAFERGWV
jgi:two-component system response regulator DesR